MPYNNDILAMLLAHGGSPALANNTIPDNSDSGRVLPDPMPFKDGGAAFGVFPQAKKRREQKSDIGEELYKTFFVPQDMLDVALMAVPFGKTGRAAAAGLSALSPMEAEAGKVKTGVDLARRSLFGLRPTQDMAGRELAPLKQASKDLDKAPKIEEKTTTITPSPDAPKVESTLKSIAETPVSRRTVLKTAAGQALKGLVPDTGMIGDIAKAVNPVESVVRQAAPAAPLFYSEAMVPGLVAEGLKMGYSFPRIMKMVEGTLGTGLKNMNEADIERMYQNLLNPHSATDMGMYPNHVTPGDAWRSMTAVEGAFGTPLSQLRQSMRSVKQADPELYETLKNLSRDVSQYSNEP
jgi:hypothetical protein